MTKEREVRIRPFSKKKKERSQSLFFKPITYKKDMKLFKRNFL